MARGMHPIFRVGLLVVICLSVVILGDTPEANAVTGWAKVKNLTGGNTPAREPKLFADNDGLHLLYRTQEVYYQNSFNDGLSWSEPKIISGDLYINSAGTIITERNIVHAAWPSSVNLGSGSFFQIFNAFSEDNGKTWSDPNQVTRTYSQAISPRLVKILNGVGLVWYELEERSIKTKEELDFDLVKNILETPFLGAIQLKESIIQRFTIMFTKSFDGGRSWSSPKAIHSTVNPIRFFTGYGEPDGDITLIWEEDRKVVTLKSRDTGSSWSGLIWRNINKLDPFKVVESAWGQGKQNFVWVDRDSFAQLVINFRKGIDGEVMNLTDPGFLRSNPSIGVDDNNYHVVWAKSNDINSFIQYIRTDSAPPKSELLEPSRNDISETEITFAWAGTDDISENLLYSYKIGNNKWSNFDTLRSITIKSPPDGAYTFNLKSMDEAENVESPGLLFPFNTFKVPPETFMISKMPEVFSGREVSFVWSGEDNSTSPDNLTFSFRFDDEGWSDFKAIKRRTISNLTEGFHSFEVRGRDEQKNVDLTPIMVDFSVDLGIEVFFTTEAPELLNVQDITLAWDSTDKTNENNSFEFRYNLDRGEWKSWSYEKQVTFNNLSSGKHLFTVESRDSAGNNCQSPQSHEFLVDISSPDTFLTSLGVDKENNKFPKMSLSSEDDYTESSGILYSYRFGDEGIWSTWSADTEIYIPEPIKFYSKGYVVEVRSQDKAGNIDSSPAEFSFKLLDRYPKWLLPVLIGLGVIFLGGVVFFIVKSRMSAPVVADKKDGKTEEKTKTTSDFDDDDDFGGGDTFESSPTTESILSDDDDDLFS